MDECKKYLSGKNYSFTNLALSYNLGQNPLTTILSGPKSREQLDALLDAVEQADTIFNDFPHWAEVEAQLSKFYE